MATKAHLDGNKRYLDKQDHIQLRVPKGKKEKLQAFAKAQNKSLNAFVVEAVKEKMEREK